MSSGSYRSLSPSDSSTGCSRLSRLDTRSRSLRSLEKVLIATGSTARVPAGGLAGDTQAFPPPSRGMACFSGIGRALTRASRANSARPRSLRVPRLPSAKFKLRQERRGLWAGHFPAFSRAFYGAHGPWLLRMGRRIMRLHLAVISPRDASADHLLLGIPCKAQRRQFRAHLASMTVIKKITTCALPLLWRSGLAVFRPWCYSSSWRGDESTQGCLGHQSLKSIRFDTTYYKIIQKKL